MERNDIVCSHSASVRLDMALRWVVSRLSRSEILVIGATRAAADEFARHISGPGSLGLHCLSLTQIASALALLKSAELGLAPLSRLGEEAVAARITHRLNTAREIEYFRPVAHFAGFAAALASTISELRLARTEAALVAARSGALLDLQRLLRAFEEELERHGLADQSRIFRLAQEIAEGGKHRLIALPAVLLDLPLSSQAHFDFITALVACSQAVIATAHPKDAVAVAALEVALSVKSQVLESDPDRSGLEHVRRYLFSIEQPPAREYDRSLDIFAAPGEGSEAVEIARRTLLLTEAGVPFDRVAVLLRSPARYQPLLEEAFLRANIPAYFTRGSDRPDPAGRAFLALLVCAYEKCSASRFAEYLSLGQTPALDSTGAPKESELRFVPPADEVFLHEELSSGAQANDVSSVATPIAWERMLVDAAVIGGRDRWFRRLRGLEQEFRLQISELKDEDPSERERLELQFQRLQNLEKFALPLIETLAALPATAQWHEWLYHLRRLAVRSLRDPASVLALLNELEPMSEVGPAGIDEVITVLAEHLRFLRREPPHRRYGHVFVGTIEEARGRSFDVVFVPGLAEGMFPLRTFEDPLLLDELRRSVSDTLTRREDRVVHERLLLHLAVGAAAHRLVISYPTLDIGQGRPRVPSFYALEIARTIEGRVPDLRTFENRTSSKAEARLIWPAPTDPLHAIDTAEYDLAWHAAHASERGSAAYLIGASPPLARSLRARYLRWEKAWSGTDGCLKGDAASRAILASKRLDRQAFSATVLQQFAVCPYRFFLSGIYGLRKREEAAPLQQMDPLTRGALFHAVQFQFFQEWQQRREAVLGELLDMLDQALDSVAAEFGEKLAPAIPRVWSSEIEDLRTDLRGWLHLWLSTANEWEPIHVELGFGLQPSDSRHDRSSVSEPIAIEGGVLVRGSIDLVEKHRTRGVLRVVDYKTGKAPEKQPAYVGGGTTLQPGIYGLAVEKILNAPADSGRLFYCTQRGGFALIDIELNANTRQWFSGALAIIGQAIKEEFLPTAPQHGACDFCDYRLVCGPHEETRVRQWKDRDALELLQNLRNMP
jgi:RecB family exonuclease